MALGDISTFSIRGRKAWSERIAADMAGERTPEEIVSSALFSWTQMTAERPRRFFGFRKQAASHQSKKVSLTAVMNIVHDAQIYGTSSGIEEISVPFPHVVLLTGFGGNESWLGTEDRIAELLKQQWQDLVDPLVELRVRFFVGQDTRSGELVAFFGRGIFAPRRDERCVGRVQIVAPDGSYSDEPKLPGGAPAGLYRGQAALAFSTMEALTPATCPLLPPQPCRFLLRGAVPGESRSSSFVLECELAGEGHFPIPVEPVEPPPGIDGAFKISLEDGRALQVLVTEDVRPSRLLRAPPDERFYFLIAGVLAPADTGDFVVARWWVDLDRDLRLVASAIRPRALSIVCEDDQIDAFDWSHPGRVAQAPARLIDIETPQGPRKALCAAGANFGYLRVPRRTARVNFGDNFGFLSDGLQTDEVPWQLDWLDFAGAAETRSLYAERLGNRALKEASSAATIPGLEDGTNKYSGVLARDGEAGPFADRWDGTWRHDRELIVGPLLLRVVDASRGNV